MQLQLDILIQLNWLDFCFKPLLSSYSVMCSPWQPLTMMESSVKSKPPTTNYLSPWKVHLYHKIRAGGSGPASQAMVEPLPPDKHIAAALTLLTYIMNNNQNKNLIGLWMSAASAQICARQGARVFRWHFLPACNWDWLHLQFIRKLLHSVLTASSREM